MDHARRQIGFVKTRAVLDNARALCKVLNERGYSIVTGGTDSPMVMVDLTSKGLTGDLAATSLEKAGLPCNKIVVPGDAQKRSVTSGLRFGTSAVTSRGLTAAHIHRVGHLVSDVLDALVTHRDDNGVAEASARVKVETIAEQFPIYPGWASALRI